MALSKSVTVTEYVVRLSGGSFVTAYETRVAQILEDGEEIARRETQNTLTLNQLKVRIAAL